MSRLGMNLISPEVITENQAGMSQEAGPGDFVRGMRAGTYGMGSSLANTGGALANAFGADQAAEGMYGTAQQLQGRAQATGPRIASLAQLEQAGYTPGNMIDYAQGVLGNTVPSAAVGMIPGAMAATPLRALGAATAAYAPMEMGDVVGKMREDNGGQPLTVEDTLQAAGTGIASAGLQSVVPAVVGAKVAGRALGEVGRAAPQSLARTMGQNVVGGGLMEGAMEGGSEALKQVGAGRDQIDWDQVKENAIAGAIGGGGMGIAGGVGDYAHSRADKIGGVLSGAMGRAKDKVTDTVGTLPGDAKTAAGDVWEAVRAGAAGAFEGFNASELGKTLNERAASIKTKVDDIMADEYVPEDIKQKAAAAAKNMGDKANQAFVWGVDKARKARDGFNDLTKDEGDDDTRTKVDKALGVLRKATGKAEDGIRNYLTPFENAEEEAAWTARLTTDPEGAAQDFRSAEGKLRTTNQARAEKIVSDPGYNEAQKQMAAAILSEPGEDPTADANAIAGLVTAKGLGDKIDTVVKAGKKVTSIFSRANDTKNNDNRNSLDFSGVDELLVKDIVEVLPEGFAEHRTKLATLASTVREVMRGIATRKAHTDDINQATGLDKLKGASIDIQLQNFEDDLADDFGEDVARKIMSVVAERLGKLDPKSANDYAAYVTHANDKYATTADLKQKLLPKLDENNRLGIKAADLEKLIPNIGDWLHVDPKTPMERMKVNEARMGLEIIFGKNWKVASRIIEDAYKPKRPSAPSATRKSLPSDDNDSTQDWDEAGYKIAEAEENFLKGPDATGYEGDVAEFYLGGDDIPQAGKMTLRRNVASRVPEADNISGTLRTPDYERRTAGKTTVSTKFGEQLQKDRPKSKVEFVTVAAHMQRHNLDEASAREQFDLPENVPLSHAGYWMASSKEAGPKSGTLRYNYYSDDGVGVNAPDKIRGSMPSPAAEAEGTPHKRGWSQTERKLNRVRSEYPDFKSSFVSLEDYAKQREISIAEAAEIFGVDPKEARDHGYIKLQGRPTDEEGGLSVHELNRIRMDSGKQKGSPALMTFRLEGDDKIAVDAVRLTRMFQQKLPYDAVDDIHPTNRMARAFMTGYAALFDRYGPSSRESDAVAKTSTVDESKLTPEQKAKRLAPEKRAKIREQSADFFGLDDDLVIGYASGSPFTIADVKKLKWRPDDKLDWMHDSKVKQALADMPRARMTDMLGRFNNRLMDAKDQLHADAVEHIKSGGVYLRGDAFLRALRAYKDENGGKVERLQQRVDDINQAIEYDRGESTKDDALQGRISNGGRQGGRMYQAGRRMAARDTLLDQAATLEHVANMSLENAGFANADNVFGGSPAKMKKGVHKAVQDSTGMAKTQGTFTGLRTDNSSTAAAKRMLAMAKEIRDAVLAQDTYHGTDMGDPETSNKSRFLGETMEAISQRMFTANAAQLKMLRNEAKMLNAQTDTMLADGPKKPNGATRKEIQKLADMRDQIDALEAIDKRWIEYQKGDLGSGRTEIDPNGSTTHALRGRTGETPTDLVHRVNQDGSYISHAGPSGHITNNWKEQDAKRETLFRLRWELEEGTRKKKDVSGHPDRIAKIESELSELGRVNNTFTEEGAKEFIRSSANSIEAWTDAVRTSKNLGKSPRAPAMAAIDRAARTAERFSHYAALFLPSGYSERLRQAMWDGNKPRNAPDVIAMLGSVVEGAKDAKVLTQRQADLYKEAVAGGELELTAGVKKTSSAPETKGKRWVGNPKAAGIEEGSPDPKGVAAKKAAFLKKAVSGDKALIEELSKSDDLKGLQRALAAVGDTELTAGLESTVDAINARINELTQDPAVAYHGQTMKYSMIGTAMHIENEYEGFPATHDSPHKHEGVFDWRSHIGKGEGNAAFGAGTYLSTADGVHSIYKNQFTAAVNGDGLSNDPEYNELQQKLSDLVWELKAMRQEPDVFGAEALQSGMAKMAKVKAAMKAIEDKYKHDGFGSDKSPTYEVSVDIEPDQLLDWNKPLSEQSALVQKALEGVVPNDPWGNDDMAALIAGVSDGSSVRIDPAYLRGEGDRFLVRHDGKVVGYFVTEAEAKNGARQALAGQGLTLVASPTGRELYRQLTDELGSQAKASDYLQSLGILGHRYNAAGGKNDTHPNYVIYDDSKITTNYVHFSAERTGPTSVDGPFSPINGKEILDYIGKTLGDQVQVAFANILHAGDFHTNEVGEHILRVSVHSLNPMSVAYHESLHSFFQRLKEMGRSDVVKVLEDSMKSDHVLDQLKTLLAHSPEATSQLSDMEERAAYAYQFWMSGQLKLAPAPKSLFTKIAAAFRKVLGMWTNDQRAEHIFRYFSSGGFAPASTSNSTLAVHSALMKPGRNFAAEALKSAVEPLARLGDAVVGVGGVRLRETGIPALRELADQIQVIKTARGSEDEGFLPASRQTRTRLLNKLATYLKDSSAENVDEAMEALQNGVKATSTGGKVAQLMMRKFLKEALDDMRAAGMKVGDLGPNYFPRVWDPLTISKNQDAFLAMLAKNNLNEDVMHHLMAHDGSEVMIDFKTDRPGMLHAKERMLNVSAADAAPFLKKDFWNIMNGYTTQMSRRMEWANRFGDDSKKFNDLMKQARKEGATDKQMELAQDYVDGVNGTLGEDVNPTWRRLQSNMIMYQNLRLLPAAIFAQFVDPVGIVVRGGTVKDGFDAFKRGLFEMRKSWQKDPKYDAATELATTLNVIEDVALRNSLSSVHGVGMMEGKLQHLNDQFFRYNFVEGYNQSMRVAGTQAAIRFVMRHASLPSQHSKRWLDEIGLKPSDIKVVNGELAMFERDGLTPAQATKMKNAINRWVDGAVLRPNAADKTIWMSDPHFAIIAHMKQFIFSFHQTILKRILHEVEHGNYTPVLAAASYVPIMLAADMAKQVLVNGGDEPEWKKNWGASDYLGHAVARSGLLGVGQFAVDSYQNVQHGGAGITPLLGPTLEQMAEGVSVLAGTRQFEKFVMRSMPANVLYKDYFKDDTVPYPEE